MPRWVQYLAVAAGLALAVAADFSSPLADASSATNYSYDAWGRVTGATYQGSGNLTTGYTYDAAGNRTQAATSGAPIANPVAFATHADATAAQVQLSVAGPYTSVAVHTAASHGTASASGTTLTYKPALGYTGADSFTYTASNGVGTSPAATVQVSIAPVARSSSTTVGFNSTNNPITYSVIGSYSSVALASRPSNGRATASGTSITYTPNTGYSGSDSFKYVALTSVVTSAPGTLSITVGSLPPVANNVSAQVNENSANNNIPLNITGGTPTSVAVATQASHGTATASGLTISYTPTTNFVGSDSFTYTASNAGGTSSPATASITVVGLTATASAPLNCPTSAPTEVCATGTTASYTFTSAPVAVTVTNGSGSYTYSWTAIGPSGGTWTTGGTGSSFTPSVSGVKAGGNVATTDYSCTVTDTVTHQQATSNAIFYQYTRTGP